MMWYAVISQDVEDSRAGRAAARPEHVERLKTLLSEGRVLIAGPHPAIDADDPGEAGFSGSLVVVDFPSLKEATAWADEDPYIAAGVYESVTVKPFKLVLP
jgi:uncharacterized protein